MNLFWALTFGLNSIPDVELFETFTQTWTWMKKEKYFPMFHNRIATTSSHEFRKSGSYQREGVGILPQTNGLLKGTAI